MSGNQNVALAFIGGAIVVAIGATWGIFELLDQYQNQAGPEEREVKTTTVVAASRTLYQGVTITNDDLFVVKIPPEYLPKITEGEAATIKDVDVFSSRERVVGRVPRERILANELVRPERLADGNAGVGLHAMIPQGMRAISLDLRGSDAITGFLEPGNYVDVVVTMKDELGELYTKTILQTVLILGVNSKAENESTADVARRGKQRPSVTFLVTQAQAEELAFANEMGKVSLSLRNVLDASYTDLDGATLDQLLNRLTPVAPGPITVARRSTPTVKPVATAAPAGATITVIKGTVVETRKAQDPNATLDQPQVHR